MAYRDDTERHDELVSIIARERFPFPDLEHPNWETFTNHPDQTMGVLNEEEEPLYPDIVVLNTDNNEAVMIGEIETSESVSEEESEQWKEYSDVAKPLYLYVPKGYCKEAKDLAEDAGAEIKGFRIYYVNLSGEIQIENC